MQAELIPSDSSRTQSSQQRAVTPSRTLQHAHQASSSSTSNSQTSQGGSPRATDATYSRSSSGARATASEHADDATSLTTRSSGSQHGMQLPSVKAQTGSSRAKNGGIGEAGAGMGSRKGSMRSEGRQTSEELPDVTGRQLNHTGVRRVSTTGRRVFGSSL